ncbi:hydrogen peroxide-inducible genes activator [Prevotella amnii]|jgi:hypothetical protein|uniref:Transcriptional regulator n=3 Tax=Prevotella amnii TaxID=419005 RepID=A0A096AVP4_9BACT|nr:hydrogen peroxide-inducible genes activator [Prevotella amnii]EFN90829.1 LysR substrate binding domain protein [Prevotella amnii CRIS 21A-A]KGF50820.1 transcriptional regulator [Prevotella amnii DNF00058]KXB79131.1 putative oxidative stress regulatory protein OxyR [Prevotella amnii]
MTLQQLEYVMAVYRHKHFARAAEHCKVTQPTLSSMIQKLEEELSVKIFDRRRQPILPTPIGLIIIEHAWSVLVRVKRLKEKVEEEKLSLNGTFYLAVLPTIAPYLIPRFLPQLMNDYPNMDIRVTELKTDDMRQAITHGDIDAGILANIEGLGDFETAHLYNEKFYVYVSKNDELFDKKAIRTVDLRGEYLWLLDEGHCFRDQLMKFCSLKSAANSKRAYNLGSIETFMRIVESGKGVTFIPELAISQLTEEQSKLVRPFAHPIPSREIIMMTGKSFVRNTLLQFLISTIQNALPQEMIISHNIKKNNVVKI